MVRLRFVLAALLPAAWLIPAAGVAGERTAQTAEPPAAAASADPMELLRQRLEERLNGTNPPVSSRPGELRLVVRPSAGSTRDKRAAREESSAGSDAHPKPERRAEPRKHESPGPERESLRVAAARHAASDGARSLRWDYVGPAGPQAWATLDPKNALCANGRRQSPIDIRDGLAVDLEPVRFNYQPGRFAVLDDGRTIQVNVAPGSGIDVAGRHYALVRLDFHRPSETSVSGRRFEMSLHLVHSDEEGRLAVVALLVDRGPAQPLVQQVLNNLPLERDEPQQADRPLDPSKLLPADRSYYTFMGSTTAPPCTEGVRWIVMRQPVTMSPEQIELFSRIYPMNARPTQPVDGRRILMSLSD
jgi:carbonic anhydrase